jgi:hypothetical protein
MNTAMAPNVRGVGAPGRCTVHSMCGMCARGPIAPLRQKADTKDALVRTPY